MKKRMTLKDMDAIIDGASLSAQIEDEHGYQICVYDPARLEVIKAFCCAKRLIIVVREKK